MSTNPGVAHQGRRNYLVEGILEAVPETLFLDTHFELQDTSVAPGGNNPSTQKGSLVTVSAPWFLYQNIRVIAEYDKQRGEGLDVLDLGELTAVAQVNVTHVGVGLGSVTLFLLYVLGMRLVFRQEDMKRQQREQEAVVEGVSEKGDAGIVRRADLRGWGQAPFPPGA